MRLAPLALASLLLLAVGTAQASLHRSSSYQKDKGFKTSPTGTYNVHWEGGLKLTMNDGVTLTADGFIPEAKDNTTKFPVLVFPNSWGMPTFEYIVKTLNFAQDGYIAIEYETRGWYESGGLIDCAGPLDLSDASQVLDYVANRSDWNPDLNNMAFVGISYGAGIALFMAATDPRVKTSIVMSGWANITKMIMPYNTPNLVWGGLLVLLSDIVGHPSPSIADLYTNVLNHQNMSSVRQYCDTRSPIRFLDNLNARDVPLFMSHNRLDRLFRSEYALDFYSMLNTTHKFLMVNQGVHAEPEVFGLIDLGKNVIWKNARQWMDHFLMGRSTDILQEAPVQMQYGDSITDETYLSFKSWPSSAVVDEHFWFNPRGGSHFASMTRVTSTAVPAPPQAQGGSGGETIAYSGLPGLSTGIPVLSGLVRSFGITYDTEILLTPEDTAIIYRSDPLEHDTRYCGVPRLNLTIVANRPTWQVYAYLYDIDALDVAYLVSNTYYTNYADGSTNTNATLKDLQFHQTCRNFPSGHRVGVGIVLFCELFKPATTDGLTVTFEYGAFAASLSMPLNPN